MAEWIAPADVVPGLVGAGAFTGGEPKLLHHSTEGSSYAGARAAYAARGNGPHFTDTFENGVYQVRQHLPLNVAATALAHPAGTGQTNRDNVIQVEHVGFAAAAQDWPAGYLAGIASLSRAIEAAVGVPRRRLLPFMPPGQAPRAKWDVWHGEGGHYGHCHVPANDHTDPGAMDIAAVLDVPPVPPTPMPAPTVTARYEEDGEMIESRFYPCGVLDAQGCGGVMYDGGAGGNDGVAHFEAIPWDRYRGHDLQASYPATDHPPYRPLCHTGVQIRGGFLFVEFYGGQPGAPVDLHVRVSV